MTTPITLIYERGARVGGPGVWPHRIVKGLGSRYGADIEGQLVAQTGPAAADQALVVHQSPAAVGENWRPAGEACAVLLAPTGEGLLTRRLFGDMLLRIWVLLVLGG